MWINEFEVPLWVYASIAAHRHHIPGSNFRCTNHIRKDLQDGRMNASARTSARREVHFCKVPNRRGEGIFMFGRDASRNNGKKSVNGGQNGGSRRGSSDRRGVVSGCGNRRSWGRSRQCRMSRCCRGVRCFRVSVLGNTHASLSYLGRPM
jgi:hypothetical protein